MFDLLQSLCWGYLDRNNTSLTHEDLLRLRDKLAAAGITRAASVAGLLAQRIHELGARPRDVLNTDAIARDLGALLVLAWVQHASGITPAALEALGDAG